MQNSADQKSSVVTRLTGVAALLAIFAGCAWLAEQWLLIYLPLVILVLFGGGYPAFVYFRKRGKGAAYLLFVSAVVGGGALGFYLG